MGIPPYHSPKEWDEFKRYSDHQNSFIKMKGYEWLTYSKKWWWSRPKKYKAPNGVTYETPDEMWRGYGAHPNVEKDGICYNFYEVLKLENYIDIWESQVNFLVNLGFVHFDVLVDDYVANNKALKEYYDQHGYVPRWKKDDKVFGNIELLKEQGWQYEGTPEFIL